jgi:hypothetical protein
MTKTNSSHRERLKTCIARVLEQWLAQGDFKVGAYKFKRSEILDAIDFEKIVSGMPVSDQFHESDTR